MAPAQHSVALPPEFPAQRLTIPTAGAPLAAWWVPAGADASAVLLLHSLRGDRASMVSRARLLIAEGYSVLLMDLQAHGESPGAAITLGWRESDDARAALRWLREAGGARSVGVIGCSLGGAAVLLGSQPAGFDAVVLEAVYPRVESAIENRIRIRLGPLAPVLTPLLSLQLRPRLGIDAEALQPIRGIGKLQSPVLVIAGADDRHTLLSESRELFAAAQQPKALWIVPAAAHVDFLAHDPRGYRGAVLPFLRQHLSIS